ncbi:MAG: hypothetical protein M1820_008543 [Bogoriella megaspora]|nr:MAG: hypothetical protein M1820_008543 [Bogoriella megaspora]
MEFHNHYNPLPSRGKQSAIRLLNLEPGQTSDPIICQLGTVPLNEDEVARDHVTYDAVSYAWGLELPRHEITLGAWPVLVRDNLWQFLKQMRNSTEQAPLWIDALCIDQSNWDERASQVQVMDRIFRGARKTIVWLGEADDDGVTAMNLIRTIAEKPAQLTKLTEHVQYSLLKWSRRSYWSRTWVVQEFLLAREIVLECGSVQLNWRDIYKFLKILESSRITGGESNMWTAFRTTPAYLLILQRASHDNLRAPLSELLIRNQHTDCTLPHDKVFAVLGLLGDIERGRKIRVNYTGLQNLCTRACA